MKIGIISDTHIKNNIENIKDILKTHFQDVHLIIHAGDYINKEVVDTLKEYTDFIGVWGNVDDNEIKDLLKEKEVMMVGNYKIGIFHGHGTGTTTMDRAYNEFKNDDVDIIIFGHSHQPLLKTKNNVLMLNPGSCTSKRRERWFSYILLELKAKNIDVQFKFLS